jgi:hypothetical protein
MGFMSASFDKLKAMLEKAGNVSPEDIKKVTDESGEMTPEEMIDLEHLKLKKGKESRKEVSMDEYLAATKKMDEVAEGSEEYKKAEEIVNAFEAGG